MTDIQREIDFDREMVAGSTKKAMAAASAGKRDLWMVPVSDLRILEGFNVRVKNAEYKQHIRSLADSMLSEGFFAHEALAGYVAKEGEDDVVYITDGHCRREAALLAISEGAELLKVPVIVATSGVTREDLTVALVRSNTGKPLTPFETGIVCKRLMTYGWDLDQIVKRLGVVSTTYVEGLLMLVGSPSNVREMVTSGEVAASTAIAALKKHGEGAYDVLQAALIRAKKSGDSKVTGKHLENAYFKKTQKKKAPEMFTALSKVNEDPAFKLMKLDTREMIEGLIAALAEAREKDEKANVKEGKGGNEGDEAES